MNASAVTNNHATIEFSNASHVYVTLCRISSNRDAISLVGSNDNTFFKNNITNPNTYYAFRLTTTSTGNHIYLNAVINSATNSATCAATGNFWDDGTLGNYWRGYLSQNPSASHNGIVWNKPYNITGAANAKDNRPLVRSPFAVNTAPRLTAGTGNPASGTQSTQFTFQVTYTDSTNDAPTGVFVTVGGVTQAMSKVTAGDIIFTDGCTYRYIGYLQPGNHTYHFSCSDGLLTNTTTTVGTIVVTKTNTNAPRLTNSTFSPANGDETTSFTFRVRYTDADNNVPATITTTIDGTPHGMTKEDPSDTNLMNGCWYSFTTTLGTGSHTFSMQCSDGTYSNSTATMQGPTVTQSPGAQATQTATTVVVVVAIVAGGVLAFAALVIYRDRLPAKMQRVIPEKRVFSRAGQSIKGGLGTAGEKTKHGFQTAGYKIRTLFSDLAFKIRHR
jgi:parallel beta-helix repeat protein